MTAADSDSAYLVTGAIFLVLLLLAKGAEEGFYLITLLLFILCQNFYLCFYEGSEEQRPVCICMEGFQRCF